MKGRVKIKRKGIHKILYGRDIIELFNVEQLVDSSQTEAIVNIIRYIYDHEVDNRKTLQEILNNVMKIIEEEGLTYISPFKDKPPGDIALPRVYEIAAAMNRLRILKMK